MYDHTCVCVCMCMCVHVCLFGVHVFVWCACGVYLCMNACVRACLCGYVHACVRILILRWVEGLKALLTSHLLAHLFQCHLDSGIRQI